MKEIKFKVQDVINVNDDYHLYVTSLAIAFNDIAALNRMLFQLYKNGDSQSPYIWVLSKTMIAHLREAYKQLWQGFEKEKENNGKYMDRLLRISEAAYAYDELKNLVENEGNNSFIQNVLIDTRNFVFHYNSNNWYDTIKSVLEKPENQNFRSSVKIPIPNPKNTYELIENDYVFAHDIQINCIIELDKQLRELKDDEKRLQSFISKLLEIVVKVLFIISVIIEDFINGISYTKYYTVNTNS